MNWKELHKHAMSEDEVLHYIHKTIANKKVSAFSFIMMSDAGDSNEFNYIHESAVKDMSGSLSKLYEEKKAIAILMAVRMAIAQTKVDAEERGVKVPDELDEIMENVLIHLLTLDDIPDEIL